MVTVIVDTCLRKLILFVSAVNTFLEKNWKHSVYQMQTWIRFSMPVWKLVSALQNSAIFVNLLRRLTAVLSVQNFVTSVIPKKSNFYRIEWRQTEIHRTSP